MDRNRLSGIKVFDKFWLKNCYYHDLYSALACLEIDVKGVFGLNFSTARPNFKVQEQGLFSESEYERISGYEKVSCNIDKRGVIKAIDEGCPVVVGVDRFALEGRAEINEKLHAAHFLLVYGYDLNTGMADVVDHDEVSSCLFREKQLSLENVLQANDEYRKGIGKEYRYTCRIFRKTETKQLFRTFSWKVDRKELTASLKNSEKNLQELKCLIQEKKLKEMADVVTEYLRNMRQSWQSLQEAKMFQDAEPEGLKNVEKEYFSMLSVFWKARYSRNFSCMEKCETAICGMLNRILVLEEKIYGDLIEKSGGER